MTGRFKSPASSSTEPASGLLRLPPRATAPLRRRAVEARIPSVGRIVWRPRVSTLR